MNVTSQGHIEPELKNKKPRSLDKKVGGFTTYNGLTNSETNYYDQIPGRERFCRMVTA